jgi:hypothetical protein
LQGWRHAPLGPDKELPGGRHQQDAVQPDDAVDDNRGHGFGPSPRLLAGDEHRLE